MDNKRYNSIRERIARQGTPTQVKKKMKQIAIELGQRNITLKDIDELVLNHKDNMGWIEGSIKDNSPLDIKNYELVKQSENIKHGKTWHKLESWGEYTTFSARDTVFIKLVEVSDSIDELKELMKTKKLKLSDYGIKDK